jgi:hypothetical protein
MGALEYEPITEIDKEFVGDIVLDALSMEAGKILQGNSSDVLDELLSLNGSSGGARPKIVALVSKDKQTMFLKRLFSYLNPLYFYSNLTARSGAVRFIMINYFASVPVNSLAASTFTVMSL